jgi:BASS family bile acid:Na+ symporter
MGVEGQNMSTQTPSRWMRVWRLYGRSLALFLAMAVGAFFPAAQSASGWIPYLLMGMLFFAFLDVSISRESFHWSLLAIFLANILIPFVFFFLLRAIDPGLALVGYLTAVTPTATAAPVIVGFLRGRVDYVATAVLLTNIGVALILPFTLPWVAGATVRISTTEVLPSVLEVMFIPLGLALFFRLLPLSARNFIRRGKPAAFPLWLLVLFLVTSKASAFLIENRSLSGWTLLSIALLSLAICVLNFALGARIGGRAFRREASQALGQKNNSFTIWVALAYLNPLAALGPTCYVVYHNLYNGFQLYSQGRNTPASQAQDPFK